jgi:hypothetical protein
MGDAPFSQVYLTESEASQVIREEVEKMGIDFNGNKTIEVTYKDYNSGVTRTGKLELDGYDATLGIGFEYVSESDINKWSSNSNNLIGLASYTEETAQRLSESTTNVVYFFNPANSDNFEYNTSEQKERRLEELRAQVRDFLAWLIAQGVI